MRRWLVNTVLLIVLAALIYVIWQSLQWQRFMNRPMVTGTQPLDFIIQPGTPLIALAWNLKRQQLINDPRRFIQLAKFYGATKKIKAGEYQIDPGMTPRIFLKQIIAGKMILRSITFIEGWTFQQIMQTINNNPYFTHTLNDLDKTAIMTLVGYPGVNPEGQFYPDTYLFTRGAPDRLILRKAYQNMQRKLNTAWQQRSADLPYTNSYQALIVASLIEKETALPQERPMIAGVILRRLQKKMLLQIDAAIIYGLGDAYIGSLRRGDLAIPTPYNLYLHQGLPPTPIAMPSISAIEAALHPTASDALYYVAKGDGGHIFSASLAEHQQAAQRYWLIKQNNLVEKTLLLGNFSTANFCPLSDSTNGLLSRKGMQPLWQKCLRPSKLNFSASQVNAYANWP
ncbi:MAG: endolytic transglycosylase MltG [Gammaproteobacteria bacterium]